MKKNKINWETIYSDAATLRSLVNGLLDYITRDRSDKSRKDLIDYLSGETDVNGEEFGLTPGFNLNPEDAEILVDEGVQ